MAFYEGWQWGKSPKKLARMAVRMAQRRGTSMPKPCAVCGGRNTFAHSPDPARPLNVRWLCPDHGKGAAHA